jgi:hypothetical protein
MPAGMGPDMLINRRKMTGDGASLLSSMSGGSSIASESEASESSSGDTDESNEYLPAQNLHGNQNYASPADRMMSERARLEAEQNEKREILFKMDRLESRGYQLPRRFTLESNLEEMRTEYDRIIREKELDASIHFQQKMMMAFVTGVEFLNTKWDPFSVRLSGWSENVHNDMEDYTDIFIDLHDKYKGSGKKMAPELRLLLSLSGSAFMFHLTNSMFRQSSTPGVEELLRSNPELLRQFQNAAMQQMGGGGGGNPAQPAAPPPQQQSPMGGIFNMMGNMFGSGFSQQGAKSRFPSQAQPMNMTPPSNMQQMPAPQRPPPPPPPPPQQSTQAFHQNITTRPPSPSQRIETLSISGDDEITSIIEDTADLVGIIRPSTKSVGSAVSASKRGRRPQPSGRTLQL